MIMIEHTTKAEKNGTDPVGKLSEGRLDNPMATDVSIADDVLGNKKAFDLDRDSGNVQAITDMSTDTTIAPLSVCSGKKIAPNNLKVTSLEGITEDATLLDGKGRSDHVNHTTTSRVGQDLPEVISDPGPLSDVQPNFNPLDGLEEYPLPSPRVRNRSRPGAYAEGGHHTPSVIPVTHAECESAMIGFVVQDDPEQGMLRDMEDLEEVQAKVFADADRSQSDVTKTYACLAALIVVSGIGALIMWLVLSPLSGENGTDISPNKSSGTTTPFLENLPSASIKAIRDDPTSAEAQANIWMWNDPYLQDYTLERQRQRFFLVAFYFATQGDQWLRKDNWLNYEVSECLWFSKATDGPVCGEQNRILTIDLPSNNLNGTLPRDFWLIKPQYFNVASNLLHGDVPPFPSDSDQFEVLIFSNNMFTGELIAEAGISAKKLRLLLLDNNYFVAYRSPGTFFAMMSKLQVFNYTINRYDNPIPPNIKYLTDLRYFHGAQNEKSGPLPSELGLLTNLEGFDFSFNTLITGTIPTEFGLLSNLKHFLMEGTQLTGALPDEFCNRDSIEVVVNCSLVNCC